MKFKERLKYRFRQQTYRRNPIGGFANSLIRGLDELEEYLEKDMNNKNKKGAK